MALIGWYSETLLAAGSLSTHRESYWFCSGQKCFWVSAQSMPCGKMTIYHPSRSPSIWNYLLSVWCHGSFESMRFSILAGIILVSWDFLEENWGLPCAISLRESPTNRMRACRISMWQSTRGKWWLTHWASLQRWIWSISEYNLWLGTPRNGPLRDHVSGNVEGADLQKPKHNPCRPVGRNRKVPILIGR